MDFICDFFCWPESNLKNIFVFKYVFVGPAQLLYFYFFKPFPQFFVINA